MPQNVEAERALLGAILSNNSTLKIIAEKILPDHFFHAQHRTLYLTMLEMNEDGMPIDLVTVTETLQGKKDLENIGGAAYISQLMDGVPQISNVAYYAAIVKEKAVLRGLIHQSNATIQQALESQDDVPTILKRAEKSLCYVLESNNGAPVLKLNGNGHVDFKDFSLADFMAEKFPPKAHLIEAITPKNGTAMIIALPHRLKSWMTTALALESSREGKAFGTLEVYKPVRTYLAQLEDWPGELQSRLSSLLLKPQFVGCELGNIRVMPRCDLDLTKDSHFAFFLGRLKEFQPDHVILDVLRKFFSGDVNSPKETAAFLHRLDQLQDAVQCSLTLVHHENRKKEEIMAAAAGSYNWTGWAQVVVHFSRKTEAKTAAGPITAVEIEVDTKVGPPLETMRLVLDMSLPNPLRMEPLEDGTGFREAMDQLGQEWDVDALAHVLDVHRKSAWKRIQKWLEAGKIEKLKSGKRGRGRALAMYRSLDPIDSL